MDNKVEVKGKLGSHNYDLLLDNIENGLIKKQQLKDIGIEMDKKVNGIFEALKSTHADDLKYVMRCMMDKWWDVKLCNSNIDVVQELRRILTEVGLQHLVHKIRDLPGRSGGDAVDTGVSGLGAAGGESGNQNFNNVIVKAIEDPNDPVRLGLIVANTYKGLQGINKLPGCEKSAQEVKKTMEYRGFKTKLCLDRNKEEVFNQDIPKFLNDVERLNCKDLYVYFSGHGGFEEGSVTVGGEFFVGVDKEHIFKYEILKRILEVAKPTTRKIFIFDCCRGTNKTEMGLDQVVKKNGLEQLKNSEFKNTYVFNTTLPYQVAIVDDITFFAKEWCKLVMLDPPPKISEIDELINAELEKRPVFNGFKQAVELRKKGITDAFEWGPKEKNVDDK